MSTNLPHGNTPVRDQPRQQLFEFEARPSLPDWQENEDNGKTARQQ